jgi:hypothetical protein
MLSQMAVTQLAIMRFTNRLAHAETLQEQDSAERTLNKLIRTFNMQGDPHHLRFAQSRALSRKVSDEFAVPLCRGHHRELHRHGDEAAWWDRLGIDVLEVARALWLESHPLPITLEVAPRDFALHAGKLQPAVGQKAIMHRFRR